jgi:hypothetical protein
MKSWVRILSLVLLLTLIAASYALARPDATGIVRSVLGGGASNASAPASGATLQGTFGQPVVGTVATAGGATTLGHGFWHGGAILDGNRIYLPLVLKSP